MGHLSLSVLGTFRAELDGKLVTTFESNKVRALLVYLAVEADRSHARESLAGLLWPDYSDRSAINNLRSALADLRNAIADRQVEPPFLIITRDTLQFNTASDYSLDISSLQDLSGLSVNQLEGVVSGCRGSFLDGFSLGDSPPYEEWVLYKREQINRQMLDALDRLALHYEDCGEYEHALIYTRRQLELEPWDENTHRQMMRLLALDGQRSAALAQYETCRQIMKQELSVAPARETTALYESIRDEIFPLASARRPGEPLSLKSEPPAPGEPPFKGLQYFSETDADLFFGRETLTEMLANQVVEVLSPSKGAVRFLAVVGASGSGKSSILRAGLIPALTRGIAHPAVAQPIVYETVGSPILFQGSVHVIIPTAHPLEALALSLTPPGEPVSATAHLIDDLASDSRSLHLAASLAARREGAAHILLVVDQFEELFSLCHNEAEREAFVDNLLYAVGVPGPTIVVIALRADFYACCAPYENLRQVLSQRQVYIGAMSSAELRRAIEGPSSQAGWVFEPGLVDLILREAGDEPGALPLLSHALLETWRRRSGRTLSLAGYGDSGGVRGAIAKTAETIFNLLTPEQQVAARNIFLRLTELGEGAQDTRRRATLDELIPYPEDGQPVQALLKKLADARLITISEDSAEVAHEALIREWTRLREWLNDDREGLRLHRHLTQTAQEWHDLDRDPGTLYRGARLAQAQEWSQANTAALNALEREFLAASLAEQQTQQAAEAARQQRELEAAQTLAETQRQRLEEQARAARKLRRGAVFLALALGSAILLLSVAIWLGQLANRNARSAQEQARLATSRELAAAAVNNLGVDPERSVLLALQALERADTLEARNSLHQALPELHILHTILAHRQTPSVAYSPDGARLASMGADGEAKVWDAATYGLLLTLPASPGNPGFSIVYSPDGRFLATASAASVDLWDADTGHKLSSLTGKIAGPTTSIVYLSFSPDSKRLAVANLDGAPGIWDLATHTRLFTLTGHKQDCDAVGYSPDGKLLATGDQAGMVIIWDAATGHAIRTLEPGGVIHSVAFSPDGKRLAAASESGFLKIWDPATGKELLSLSGMSGLYDVAFMPDGNRLVACGQDGTARVWDVLSGQQLLTLAGNTSTVVGVAPSPDGSRIATAGYDGTVKIWDSAPGRELSTLVGHTDVVWDVSYSPDGTRLATASVDGTARLWDVATGQTVMTLTNAGLPPDGYTSLAFSPDGSRLGAGSVSGTAYIWDLKTGQQIMALPGHTGLMIGIAFSPDGGRLATTSWDGTGKIWDVERKQELLTLHGPNQGVVFSPDGKHLFTCDIDGFVRMWDSATGQEQKKFSEGGQDLYGVSLRPDGKLLAISRQDGVVTLWDVASGKNLQMLSGHAGLIIRIAFSRDGTRLATASFDKQAKIWDVKTGQELFTLYGNSSNVFGVSFSPDGTRLATAGGDGTVRIYTLQMDELIALARSRLTRSLTAEECRKYLHLEQCPSAQ